MSFLTNNQKRGLQSFLVFCTLLVAALSLRVFADDEAEARFVSPSQFFQSNPLPENTITFSNQSAEKIEFKKSDVVELRIKGKVLKAGELYVDDTKIPLVNRNFDFTLKLSFEEKKYRLRFLGANAFPVIRDFKIRFVNRPQTTINANILTDDGKVVSKWTGLVGSFPSSEWIEMAWGSEVISNEELKAKEIALIRAEEARLALERARALEIEKALKKAEEEKVAKELARIKAEEAKIALERVKAQEEEEKIANELARKKAQAEEMEKTLAKAKEEKAERELARKKAEEEELARIKEEEEKAQALAQAKAEAEEAKKSQEEEREVASVTNELQEQLPPRIPLGFKVFQGVGAYSLTQTNLGTLSSLHLLLKADFEKDLSDTFLARITSESFLVPLSVSGVSTAPTLLKIGLEWGMKVPIGDNLKLVPSIGLNYQSLLTSGGFGYRDLMGPRLKLEQEYRVSENRVLYGGMSLHFFGSDTAILTPSNYELGIRIYQEWKNFSHFFPSFFVGGEYSRLSLTFSNANLSSSLFSGFLGVSF